MHYLRRLLLAPDPDPGTPAATPPASDTSNGKKKDPAEVGLGKRLADLEKRTDERFGLLDGVVKSLSAPAKKDETKTPVSTPAKGGFFDDALEALGLD